MSLKEFEPIASDGYCDIGPVHWPVSTTNPMAQKWFDRGLTACYGFNHEEAARCFTCALKQDPSLATAHWGIAYALGNNYNNPFIMLQGPDTEHTALKHAKQALQMITEEKEGGTSEVEKEMIKGIQRRYSWPSASDRSENDTNYRDDMAKVASLFPDDAHIIFLYVESLMNLRAWHLWDPLEDGSISQDTLLIRSELERLLLQAPQHAGLLHLYIHCMELSPEPELALAHANTLRDLVPGSGHLLHMPSHIDVWVGHYKEAVDANVRAVESDEALAKLTGEYHNFYMNYRFHNYHFVVWMSMMDGQYTKALTYARSCADQLTEDVVRTAPDFTECYKSIPYHVLIRFGKWEDILNEPLPGGCDGGDDGSVWVVTKAMARFARALAHAALNQVAEAEREQHLFQKCLLHPAITGRKLHNNSFYGGEWGGNILEVAEAMLTGEILYRKKSYEEAFVALRKAVELEDGLTYDEPWGWMQPVRHALGALLTEQGRVAEAKEVFEKDLKRYPNNLWSLRGLLRCVKKAHEGQEGGEGGGEHEHEKVVDDLKQRLLKVSCRADTVVSDACFCAGRL